MTTVTINGQSTTHKDAKSARRWCRSLGLSVTNATHDKAADSYNFDSAVPYLNSTVPTVKKLTKKTRKNRKPHVQKFAYLSAPIPTDPEVEGYWKLFLGRHDLEAGDIIMLSGHTFRVLRTEATNDHMRTKLFVEDTPLTFVLFAGEQFEIYRK